MVTTRTTTSQKGAVALITAMIVSILLLITTAGMVSLTVKSVRQSTDGAQSTKAYYAAESGLEDALLRLRRDPNYTGNCTGGSTPASPKGADTGAVTCARITQMSGAAVGRVERDKETDQIDISALSNVGSVMVEWSKNASLSTIPNYAGTTGFPGTDSTVQWGTNAPGVLEVGIIEYPDSNSFSIANVGFYQNIIAPMSSVRTDPSWNIAAQPYISYRGESSLPNKAYITEGCTPAAEYQCKMLIANFNASAFGGNKRYVLRIKSRYAGADYRVTVRDRNGNTLDIPGNVYNIDVTARAGDVFRRARTSFTTVPESINGLDYVLYSDTDICKNYKIQGNSAVDGACSAP